MSFCGLLYRVADIHGCQTTFLSSDVPVGLVEEVLSPVNFPRFKMSLTEKGVVCCGIRGLSLSLDSDELISSSCSPVSSCWWNFCEYLPWFAISDSMQKLRLVCMIQIVMYISLLSGVLFLTWCCRCCSQIPLAWLQVSTVYWDGRDWRVEMCLRDNRGWIAR